MDEPGTRIVREWSKSRVVDGVEYRLTCAHWNDTTLISWDVYDQAGDCLTEVESFDDEPTDDQIREAAELAKLFPLSPSNHS